MTPKIKRIYDAQLEGLGLSQDQVLLYKLLLTNGPRQAGWLARIACFSRPQTYKLLEQLIEAGVAQKEKREGTVTHFSAAHPFSLQKLVRQKQEDLHLAEETLEGVMGSLITEYTRSSQTPGFLISSGIKGIEQLYKDILITKSDLCIIRAGKDKFTLGLSEMVTSNVKKQYAANIRSRALCPASLGDDLNQLKKHDTAYGIERRTFPHEIFSLPAQIMIYSNKVGIIAYGDIPLTTVIDNDAISKSFQILFEILWSKAEIPY